MDPSLVEAARGGDDAAFAALVRGYRRPPDGHRLLRPARCRAEDAVQASIVTAWEQLPRLRDPERFEAWIRKLVVDACYAEHRRSRRQVASIRVIQVVDEGIDVTVSIVDRDALERGTRRLPPDQQAVFVYRHYLGFSLDEIAAELEIPLGTVKSRLRPDSDESGPATVTLRLERDRGASSLAMVEGMAFGAGPLIPCAVAGR